MVFHVTCKLLDPEIKCAHHAVNLTGAPQGDDGEGSTEEADSPAGSSAPSRKVPWDQLARESEPGGRPTPGEAEPP